jgi:hypothetical protein
MLIKWERGLTAFVERMLVGLERISLTSRSWFQGEIGRRLSTIREELLPRTQQLGLEVHLVRQILRESLTQVEDFDEFFLGGANLARGRTTDLGFLDAIMAKQGVRERAKAEEYFRRLGEEPIVLAKEIADADEEATYAFAFNVVKLRDAFLKNLYSPIELDLPSGAGEQTLVGLQKYILVVDEDARQAAADFHAKLEEWDISKRSLKDGHLGRFVLRLMSSWIQSELSEAIGQIDEAVSADELLTVVGDAIHNEPEKMALVLEEVRSPWIDQTSDLSEAIQQTISDLRALLKPSPWSSDSVTFKALIEAHNEHVGQFVDNVVRAQQKQVMWTTWLAQLSVHVAGAYETDHVHNLVTKSMGAFDTLSKEWEAQGRRVEDTLIWGGLFRLLLPRPPDTDVWDLAAINGTLPSVYSASAGNAEVVNVRYLGNGSLQYPLHEFLPRDTQLPTNILAGMRTLQGTVRQFAFDSFDRMPDTISNVKAWTALLPRWKKRRATVEELLSRLPFTRPPEERPDMTPDSFFADMDQVLALASEESILQVNVVATLNALSHDPTLEISIPPNAAALPRGILFQNPEPRGWLLSAAQVGEAVAFMDWTLAQYEYALTQRLVDYTALQIKLEALQQGRFIGRDPIRVQLPITKRETALRQEVDKLPLLDTFQPVQLGRKVVLIRQTLDVPNLTVDKIEALETQTAKSASAVADLGTRGGGPVGATEKTFADLRSDTEALENFADQTEQDWEDFRRHTGPPTKSTFTAYERRAAVVAEELATRVAPFQNTVVIIPIPITPLEESRYADVIKGQVERMWRASEQVATKLRDIGAELATLRQQFTPTSLASAPDIERHLAWVAAKWTVPAYEDEGGRDDEPPRPKWRLAQPGTENAARSWAAFGGARPAPEDEVLAATVFTKSNREAAVEAERRRLGPILREEAERARMRELYLLSKARS